MQEVALVPPTRVRRFLAAFLDALVPLAANVLLLPAIVTTVYEDLQHISLFDPNVGADPHFFETAQKITLRVLAVVATYALFQGAIAGVRSTTLGGLFTGLRFDASSGVLARTLTRILLGSALAIAPAALVWSRVQHPIYVPGRMHCWFGTIGVIVVLRFVFDVAVVARDASGRTLFDRLTGLRVMRRVAAAPVAVLEAPAIE